MLTSVTIEVIKIYSEPIVISGAKWPTPKTSLNCVRCIYGIIDLTNYLALEGSSSKRRIQGWLHLRNGTCKGLFNVSIC